MLFVFTQFKRFKFNLRKCKYKCTCARLYRFVLPAACISCYCLCYVIIRYKIGSNAENNGNWLSAICTNARKLFYYKSIVVERCTSSFQPKLHINHSAFSVTASILLEINTGHYFFVKPITALLFLPAQISYFYLLYLMLLFPLLRFLLFC